MLSTECVEVSAVGLQVLFASVFGATLLGEHLSLLSLAGSVLIAAGVVLANLRPSPTKKADSELQSPLLSQHSSTSSEEGSQLQDSDEPADVAADLSPDVCVQLEKPADDLSVPEQHQARSVQEGTTGTQCQR